MRALCFHWLECATCLQEEMGKPVFWLVGSNEECVLWVWLAVHVIWKAFISDWLAVMRYACSLIGWQYWGKPVFWLVGSKMEVLPLFDRLQSGVCTLWLVSCSLIGRYMRVSPENVLGVCWRGGGWLCVMVRLNRPWKRVGGRVFSLLLLQRPPCKTMRKSVGGDLAGTSGAKPSPPDCLDNPTQLDKQRVEFHRLKG
jgi:hypothetical protein